MGSDEAIIRPVLGKNSPELGPTAAMVGNGDDAQLLTELLELKQGNHRSLYLSRLCYGNQPKPRFSVVGPFVGAPYAVILLETLIAWGVRKVIVTGWCGAISPDINIGDILVPNGAIADEGTSKHYKHSGNYPVSPTGPLTDRLKTLLTRQSHAFHEGLIWTTDGIFRETPEKVMFYQQKNALAVEMELSAVFSVAHFHRIEICAILVVSDELSSLQWHPGFTDKRFINGRKRACRIAGDFCRMVSDEVL